MKKLIISIICFIPMAVMAKEPVLLALEEAYDLAIKNYPITRQKDLIARTSGLNMKSLSSGFWPQVTLSGQATYQSAVTEVPIKIPQFQFESLSKDQYRALLDINQAVYDGGNIKSQKSILEQQRLVDEQKIDVEYQKQGVGKALIRTTQSRLGAHAKIILLSAPKAVEYYPKIGFEPHNSAWTIPANRELK